MNRSMSDSAPLMAICIVLASLSVLVGLFILVGWLPMIFFTFAILLLLLGLTQ